MSSSRRPTARSIARAGARSGPRLRAALCFFNVCRSAAMVICGLPIGRFGDGSPVAFIVRLIGVGTLEIQGTRAVGGRSRIYDLPNSPPWSRLSHSSVIPAKSLSRTPIRGRYPER